MAYSFITDVPKERFNEFVSHHPQVSVLQSYDWAKVKENWDHIYTGVEDENGDLVGAALVLIKRLPAGTSMLYIPRGPVMDYGNAGLVDFYMKSLKKEAKKYGGLFIKMDPHIVINQYRSKDRNDNRIPELDTYMENLKNAGCIHQGFTTALADTIQPRFESVIPYTEGYEKNLPKNTKRNINIANRFQVEVIHGHEELVDDFAKIMAATEERKNISLRDRDYFEKMMKTFKDDAVIFLARSDIHGLYRKTLQEIETLEAQLERLGEDEQRAKKKTEEKLKPLRTQAERLKGFIDNGAPEGMVPLAGTLCIKFGPICEMPYGGLDGTYLKFMAQYKEYMENFRWAFEQGCTLFSMGGVEGSLDDGLTHFKDHFSPIIHEMIGEFDLPVNPLLYKPAKALYLKRKASIN